MCQDTHWATVYVKMHQQQHLSRTSRMPRNTTHATILSWQRQLRHTAEVEEACTNLAHPDRLRADSFLIESVLYEFVCQKSAMRLVVPSAMLISKYVLAWECRPMCEVTRRKLAALKEKRAHQKNWCQRFRHRWNIGWGVSPPNTSISPEEMTVRVPVLATCIEDSAGGSA